MHRTENLQSKRLATMLALVLPALGVPAMCWGAPSADAGTLGRLLSHNPHLSVEDPRQFPMRIRSLLADPYTFFRGTADLFYEDCAASCMDWIKDVDAHVLVHGDLHIGNLGTIDTATTGECQPQFGLVDFDEVFEGPFQLDLLRAMTSIRFAATPTSSLTEDDWQRVASALRDSYAEGLDGRIQTADLPHRHATVAKLLKKSSRGERNSYVDRYVQQQRQFRTIRRTGDGPNAVVKDLMEPVSPDVRRALISAVNSMTRPRDVPVTCSLQDSNGKRWPGAVVDVCRWTRLGSSGSQGIDKYLLLAMPSEPGTVPTILELKAQPAPAAARVGLIGRMKEGDR